MPRPPAVGLSEEEGRQVLREAFTRAGFEIVEDFDLEEEGLKLSLDGWDPQARVGYEYMTREAGDKEMFGGVEIGRLLELHAQGKLSVLLVDGEGKPDRDMLRYLADNFLEELDAGPTVPRPSPIRRAQARKSQNLPATPDEPTKA